MRSITREDTVEPWRTAVTEADGNRLAIRGVDVVDLIQDASFADVVGLLIGGRRPEPSERRLLDAILVAIADHGAGAPSAAAARVVATGNRAAPEAAVAAGILAIGDAHAGAGLACMEVIAAGLERAKRESLSIRDAARRVVEEARASGRRLPGYGHRMYREDPRTTAVLSLADEAGVSGRGVEFARALEVALAQAVKPLPLNVDGAIAAVLHDLGYHPLTAKFIFIIGRTAGLAAHVMEEYTRERPMRIRIPVIYDGPPSAVGAPAAMGED
jgi:citrate synthase